LNKKLNIIFFTFFFTFFNINFSQANFQEELINKYKTINTLSFDFIQRIGDKVESGNCHIKYPLLMKCEYPKKKKIIIVNGKKFAVIKKRYKKIYYYPLKKTPLLYLLNKENILNLIQNYKPILVDKKYIEYELIDNNFNTLNIFFDKNSLELSGWKTIDAYSNEVDFLIKNIEINVFIKKNFFVIPKEEDL
jgi:outer membrane lipoprotein-sorting protein